MVAGDFTSLATAIGPPLAFIVWMFFQSRGKPSDKHDIAQELVTKLDALRIDISGLSTRVTRVETILDERDRGR